MSTLLSYIVWDPDQVMFHVGHFGLRWYSMCWLMGLLLGYLLMQRLYKQQHIPDEKFEPLFIYIFVSVLVGARLGHCLFYQPDYFLSSWDHFSSPCITCPTAHGNSPAMKAWPHMAA